MPVQATAASYQLGMNPTGRGEGERREGERVIGRPLRISWREGDDAPSLKARYQAEKRGAVRQRLHALWLLRLGHRVREVARLQGGLAAKLLELRLGVGSVVGWLAG